MQKTSNQEMVDAVNHHLRELQAMKPFYRQKALTPAHFHFHFLCIIRAKLRLLFS
jgi:hypothetical protein